MSPHHFKIAFRSLYKRKLHSVVNILGLSLGIGCCLLITLYILDELSYDRFHDHPEQIYRLRYDLDFQGREFSLARAPITIAPRVKEFFPEVDKVARVYPRNASIAVHQNENDLTSKRAFEEDRVFFADSSFLEVLSFDFLEGNPATALDAPFSAVISESMARKYFDDANPIGRQLEVQGAYNFRVTGIFRDLPSNSHIQLDFIFPFDNMYDIEQDSVQARLRRSLPRNWLISHSHTYFRLYPGASADSVNKKFIAFNQTHGDPNVRDKQTFSLQPITDIRLRAPDIGSQVGPVSSMTMIYLFAGIALITLLIACINFINLSTAGYIKRATEVGIRKVLGADKAGLVQQFLSESWLITFFAFVLALFWVALLLPTANELMDKTFILSDLLQWDILLAMVIVIIATGLMAGSYPAWFVARFPIVPILKGKTPSLPAAGKIDIRKVLVVVQFTASVVLIIGTMALYRQVNFLTQQPLGFDDEQIITMEVFSQNLNSVFGGVDGPMRQKMNAFEDKLASHPNIDGSTLSARIPGVGVVNRNVIPEGYTFENRIVMPVLAVDYDFAEVYGLETVAGRDFDQSFGTDHLTAFIINEQAVEQFGWGTPDSAIGKNIEMEGKVGNIVGVIKNFNFQSLSQPIESLLMEVSTGVFTVFSVRLLAGDVPGTIDYIEDAWQGFFPEKVFEYNFLDAQLDEQYESEQQLSRTVSYFSILAIFISCLGLFSLSLFMAIDRAKEVAIRKVLGASVMQLVALLSGGFLKLIVIATVIAWPLAYWALDSWLEDYAYKISLQIGLFLIPTIGVLVIALLTIGFQTIRTAQTHPVEALRDE